MSRLVRPTTSDEVVVAQLAMLLATGIRFLTSFRDGDAFAGPDGIALFDLLEQVLHLEQSKGGFCFAVQLSESSASPSIASAGSARSPCRACRRQSES
jgi:hypothetical protein